jgi:tRNA U34 2-thiouridine synthase MnmA/TrmU
MPRNECVIIPLLPPSLFPPNTIWELEVRALTPQELLNTAATECETVILYTRYKPLQELLKKHIPPDRIVQVTAGSYGHGLLRHNTVLYVTGFNNGPERELHVIEVKIKRNSLQHG